jgi:hypothetical protein
MERLRHHSASVNVDLPSRAQKALYDTFIMTVAHMSADLSVCSKQLNIIAVMVAPNNHRPSWVINRVRSGKAFTKAYPFMHALGVLNWY